MLRNDSCQIFQPKEGTVLIYICVCVRFDCLGTMIWSSVFIETQIFLANSLVRCMISHSNPYTSNTKDNK